MPIQHHFDPISRLYTRSSEQMINPRNPERFLPVAFATQDPLPELQVDQAAQRNNDDTAWLVVEDHRGTIWNIATKEQVEHREIGPIPDGYTSLEPSEFDEWDGSAWVTNNTELINTARLKKASEIKSSFSESIATAVAANATTWNGGMDSALALDGAVRIAEQLGATTVTLFDSNNDEHVVDIATGKAITAAVGVDYQTKFAQKQQLMRAIASASTEAEIAAITWS